MHQFTREHGEQLLDGQWCPVVGLPAEDGARIDTADFGGGLDREARADEAQVAQGALGYPDRYSTLITRGARGIRRGISSLGRIRPMRNCA